MSETAANQTELLDEDLTAYLDGQLDAEAARRIEQRLSAEAPVRRRLQQLAQSWDLLDQLPRATVDEGFTQTTVELVALAAEEDLTRRSSVQPVRRRRRWIWAATAAIAAGLAGFVAAATVWTNPNGRLLADLPVIENLDVYRQVEGVDFLHKLNDETLFNEDSGDSQGREPGGAKEPTGAKETAALKSGTPREQVAAMTAAEKDELHRKYDEFLALPSGEQQRLRQLNADLRADPQGEQLQRVMERYYDWLKSLLPADRAELLALAPIDRIGRIKTLKHEQEARLATINTTSHLSTKDVQALHQWIAEYAAVRESEMLADLLPERRTEIKALDDAARRKALTFVAWQQWRVGKTVSPSEAEMRRLTAQLSPDARKALDSQSGSQQRIDMVRGWIQAVARVRFGGERTGKMGPAIGAAELNRFFEHDLAQADRDRLMAMPSDEMHRELRRLYFQHNPGARGEGHGQHGGHGDATGAKTPESTTAASGNGAKPDAAKSSKDSVPGSDAVK